MVTVDSRIESLWMNAKPSLRPNNGQFYLSSFNFSLKYEGQSAKVYQKNVLFHLDMWLFNKPYQLLGVHMYRSFTLALYYAGVYSAIIMSHNTHKSVYYKHFVSGLFVLYFKLTVCLFDGSAGSWYEMHKKKSFKIHCFVSIKQSRDPIFI